MKSKKQVVRSVGNARLNAENTVKLRSDDVLLNVALFVEPFSVHTLKFFDYFQVGILKK